MDFKTKTLKECYLLVIDIFQIIPILLFLEEYLENTKLNEKKGHGNVFTVNVTPNDQLG